MSDEDQPTAAIVSGTAAGAPDDPLIGRVLDGRFRIVRKLATGGMGRVYLAEQKGLDRTVALKVLATDEGEKAPRFRERFFREAKLCSRLTHPNTVRIYDYGQTEDGIFYIAMEFLDGQTLSTLLRQEGPLDPVRAVNFAMQVCGSLAEAHALGLIHRDLKPDNLIVTRTADGREFVRVVDFGIAKDTTSADLPTEAGMVYGSPGYMSPEQILDQPLTPRSDIYSLGAILYRMATGAKPFGSANPVALLTRHVYSDPQPFSAVNRHLEVPASLEWVTLTCLAKDPADRFATSSEVARALKVCELEARGLLSRPVLRLEGGRLVLPPEVEEGLKRYGGDVSLITPSPMPALSRPRPSDPGSQRAEPTVEFSGTVSLSQRLRHPVVLLLGGLVPMMAVLVLGSLLILISWLGWLAWRAGEPVADLPLPPLERQQGTVAPAAAALAADAQDAAPGTEEALEPIPAATAEEPAPAPAPPAPAPRPRPRPRPAPTPAPVVSPGPAPVSAPAPVPVPAPPPVPQPAQPTDPSRRSDLRNPFED